VNTMRDYISRPRILFLLLLLVSLIPSSALFAQNGAIAQRLSPDTVFCMQWHGRAFLADADKRNHVLQLIEDPAFAPVWLTLANRVQQETHRPGVTGPGLGLPDMISFLDNPLAFGVAAIPNAPQSSLPSSEPPHFGVFVVYDATGKASLIQKWKDLGRAGGKQPAEITKYDFGGTSVEVRTAGKNVSYSAQVANYYLGSDQKQMIEDLVTRFGATGRPTTSLAQLPEYQEIRKYIGSDAAFEWFARMPDLHALGPRGLNGETSAKLAKSMQLEKIHVAGGGLSFAGAATHLRGTVLGDTSAGGIFDLAGASAAAFQMQPLVNGSSSFSISRLNPLAAYQWARGAAMGALPPQQSASILMLEGAAQKFLGMPIVDALGLPQGEVASVSSYSAEGSVEQLYAVGIEKPDAVLRVLRAIIGSMITAEDPSGTTAYLDIAYPYKDPKTGTQRKKLYYLAVTPQMILAAPRKAMLRDTVARLGSGPGLAPAAGIFANPEYLQMRSLLPRELSGLSGTDITQIPWDKLLTKLQAQLEQTAKDKNGPQPPDLNWLKPEAVSRHLHVALSGWWVDSSGVYFDSYIQ
jgi:hypothetical protein